MTRFIFCLFPSLLGLGGMLDARAACTPSSTIKVPFVFSPEASSALAANSNSKKAQFVGAQVNRAKLLYTNTGTAARIASAGIIDAPCCTGGFGTTSLSGKLVFIDGPIQP